MNEANRPLTLQEAADHVGTSRSRLWRAMSDGHLNVEKRRVAGRNVWTVRESDLIEWAQEFLGGADLALDTETLDAREQSLEHPRTTANVHEQSSEHPRTFVNDHEQSYERPRTSVNNREHSRTNVSEQISFPPSSPPVELYLALVDRVQRAERRTVELEMTLQQSQRLLCENAESITEREARAQHAEAVVERQQEREHELAAENARLATELETTRLQLEEAQKPKGLFSWLSLRKKRTSSNQVDKAV